PEPQYRAGHGLGRKARSRIGRGSPIVTVSAHGARRVLVLDLNALLKTLVSNGGSDLHLVAGSPPYIRVNGVLRRLKAKVLTPQDTVDTARFIIPADRPQRSDHLLAAGVAYSAGHARPFRVEL